MGGGDDGDPLLGPTTDDRSDSADDAGNDSRQSGMHEHIPEEQPEETTDDETGNASGAAPTGEASGGVGGVPIAPPAPETSETSTEDGGDEGKQAPDSSEPDQSEGPEDESDPNDDVEDDDDEKEDDDDDDENEQVATITIHSDPWDNTGLGLYPIRYQLQEEYGDQVVITDEVVPVREFDSPKTMSEEWEHDAQRHGMPVNLSVWIDNPPKSSELSCRAYAVARQQGHRLATDYMRRLRLAAIVEARNIEDYDTLVELAGEVGLDADQFHEDWDSVTVSTSKRNVEPPRTVIHVDGETITQSGYLHVEDLKMLFEQAGLEEEDPQPLPGFVSEYGPVAVKDVCQVYGLDTDEAMERLQSLDDMSPIEYGSATFWTSL